MNGSGDGPLAGLLVLELGQIYNGPYAGLLMAIAGADVIKVEPPRGDRLRVRDGRTGVQFAMLNSHKRSVTLNLKTDDGRALLLQLVARADVVIENFAPGVMERLGVAPKDLLRNNPRLVYGSGSGYGRSGPHSQRLAMDLAIQAYSGAMSATGFPDRPPVRSAAAMADFFGGVHLYAGIVTALLERESTGHGRLVEVAMLDALLPSLSTLFASHFQHRDDAPERNGNRHGFIAPYDVYACSDGFIAILCGTDEHWQRLCSVIDRPELALHPKLSTSEQRVENNDLVDSIIAPWSSTRTRAAAATALESGAVPCASVRSIEEVIGDEHLVTRGALSRIEHPELGRLVVPNSPLRFDEESARDLGQIPDLGEHNEDVFMGWLGVSSTEFHRLQQAGAI